MMVVQETLTMETLLSRVASLMPLGSRFVTMTAVDNGDDFTLYYHFDRNFKLFTMSLKVPKPGEVPSISGLCFPALIVENEIQDLFGITFTGLEVDYRNHFLLSPDAPVKPFCHVPGVGVSTVDKAQGGDK